MPRVERVVGDHGSGARLSFSDATDANGQPVTTGIMTLRASGMFEGTMTFSDGTWFYDPVEGDLDTAGKVILEAESSVAGKLTIPGGTPWELHVRAAGKPPS